MKKNYSSPELEIVKFHLSDVVLASPTESIPEIIATEGDEIDLEI